MSLFDPLVKLYSVTDDGLEIIHEYYPKAAIGKKFSMRSEDKTPSASLVKPGATSQYHCYCIKDWGGSDNHYRTPIDICMAEEGLEFMEAVKKWCERKGIMFDGKSYVPPPPEGPITEWLEPNADQKEGYQFFKEKGEIAPHTLNILCPGFTPEMAEELHWKELEYVEYYCKTEKGPRILRKTGTDKAPILARECIVSTHTRQDGSEVPSYSFYKIYTPVGDKKYRFSYFTSSGKPKPADYINGLVELRRAYDSFNEEQREQAREASRKERAEMIAKGRAPGPDDGKDDYKPQKLPAVIICSGERDACSVKRLGYSPIWFNSETAEFTEGMYNEIAKYAREIYNVPDLDATGRDRGIEKALRHIELRTIWLPDELSSYRDHRGGGGKDLRDWMAWETKDDKAFANQVGRKVRQKRCFEDMMDDALTARFWEYTYNDKKKREECSISMVRLLYFLSLNGFCALRDDNSEKVRYVRICGNVVTEIRARDIRRFVVWWSQKRYLNESLRNMILTSKKFAENSIENLVERTLDFTSYTPQSQFMFFKNGSVEVTATDIRFTSMENDGFSHYVWDGKVFPHGISLPKPKNEGDPIPSLFTITPYRNADGDTQYRIRFNREIESCVMGYVINSSRLYWRKELEENFVDADGVFDSVRAKEYHKANKFRIDGEGLTPEEIDEQMQNLVNKIFTIGYMLHKFKSPSRGWVPFAMDNKIGDIGQCNGRSGKSFLFKALSYYCRSVTVSGRDKKLMDNPHVWDQVNTDTDFIVIDDMDRSMKMARFYDLITSNMTVNPKNNQSFTIPFEQSPKLVITTNYVPSDFDASSQARMLYLVFSDYYHQKSEDNDYLESRSIRDDFGHDLFGHKYKEQQWNADSVFFLDCLRFYLSVSQDSVKIQPPMKNIIIRKLKDDMGANFESWAQDFFAEDSENLDRVLIRSEVCDEFRRFSNEKHLTMQTFNKRLQAFCDLCPYIKELNPECIRNRQNRLTKTINGQTVSIMYVESYAAAQLGEPSLEYVDFHAPRAAKQIEPELNFDGPEDDSSFIAVEERM